MLARAGNRRIPAAPGLTANCPGCGEPVTAKCGNVNIWHWSHKARSDCDEFSEPMTEWHADWQKRFPQEYREAVIANHRADILLPSGLVIEFQHSGISALDINEREACYVNRLLAMVWVFDARDAVEQGRLSLRRKPGNQRADRYRTFRWRHPRRTVAHCSVPVFLDVGHGWLLDARRIYFERPCGGWGYLLTADQFAGRALGGSLFTRAALRKAG